MPPKYLKKDRQGWYVRVRVPKDIQSAIGSTEIKRTLKTRDEAEAIKKRYAVLAEVFALFEEARNPKASDSLEVIRDMVKALREGREPEQELQPVELLGLAREKYIRENYGDPDSPSVRERIKEQDHSSLRSLGYLVDNPDSHSLGDTIDTYLAEKKATITNQTYNTKARRLKDFAEWIGTDTILEAITKRKSGEYVTSRLASMSDRYGRPLSPKTKRDTASDLRAFFHWCEGRGYIETNPFTSVMKTLGNVIKGAPSNRRGWNRSELAKLLSDKTLREDKVMMGLVMIGLYSGMRGNEIAELRLEDVTEDYLRVTHGKNNNSIRKVPIHSKIAPLVEHLKSTSKDEYLLEGLTRGGEDKKRYHNIGKKFNRRKAALGFGKDTVFHSFRHSLATALENAGVPRELAELVVGHSDQNRGLTYSLYSDGLDHDVLAETLNKASYGDEVDAIVDEIVTEARAL
jgi:integrase